MIKKAALDVVGRYSMRKHGYSWNNPPDVLKDAADIASSSGECSPFTANITNRRET